jgi:hypothetical protein
MSKVESSRASAEGEGRGVGCDEVRRSLCAAHHPGEPLPAPLTLHLSGCEGCRAFRADLVLLDGAVHEQAPELPEGFELSLRRRLTQAESALRQTPPSGPEARMEAPAVQTGRPWARTAIATAALLLGAVGALLYAAHLQSPGEDQATCYRLRLTIQSARAYPEVLFDVDLPEGVRAHPELVEAIGAGQSLRWRSALPAGRSEIDLPLVARSTAETVRIQLRVGDEVLTRTVTFGRSNAGKKTSASGARAEDEPRLAFVIGEPSPGTDDEEAVR